MLNLGTKIQEGLYKKRMKQVELAKKIGKSPQQICDWIKGRTEPKIEDFVKLAKELDIVKDIFEEEESIFKTKFEQLQKELNELKNVMIRTNNSHAIK